MRGAVALYDSKIAAVIWKKLKEEEKKKFISVSEDEVPGFTENQDLFRLVLQYLVLHLYLECFWCKFLNCYLDCFVSECPLLQC